jgi:hypothetical protein
MGGDLAKIQRVGEYLIEVWKAAGMPFIDSDDGNASSRSQNVNIARVFMVTTATTGALQAWKWIGSSSNGPRKKSTNDRMSTGCRSWTSLGGFS